MELRFGPFRLDTDGRRLWREGQETVLTPKALDLLIYLADHAGAVLSRDQLLEALWPGTYVDDHALSVQIGEIRLQFRWEFLHQSEAREMDSDNAHATHADPDSVLQNTRV